MLRFPLPRRLLPLLVLTLALGGVQAQPVRVAGTRAMLEPPAGYRVADGFAGFQNDDLQAALMVVELAGAPLVEMIAGMTPEGFRAQGIRNMTRRDVTVNGAPALLVSGTQEQGGTAFAKWILVTGDDEGVILVNATVPRASARAAGPALERAAMSLTWGDEGPADLFEGLGFTLDVPDGLLHHTRMGAALSLSASPAGPGRGTDPLYIAARGTGRLPGDLAATAEARIQQTATLTDFGSVDGHAVTVDGKAGYEAVAQAVKESSGAPVTVYVVLVPDNAATYTLFQGVVGADQAGEWLPRFRAMTASVRWKSR